MNTTLAKVLYYSGIPFFLRKFKDRNLTVLSLHRVSNERDYFFNPIIPETFVKLIEYCLKYYSITNFEYCNKKSCKPKLILSFDDGYYDFIEIVLPILKRYGLPSNHNVVNSCINNNEIIWSQKLNDIFNYLKDNNIKDDEEIGKHVNFHGDWDKYYLTFFKLMLKMPSEIRNHILLILEVKYGVKHNYRMMNWEEVIYCSNNDVEIGCHTYNHDSLYSIEDISNYDIEIQKSIFELDSKLKKRTKILALPNGQYNQNVVAYIEKTNIDHLLLVDDKINILPLQRPLNLVSRINIADNNIFEMILRAELFHSKIKKII